MSDDDDDDDDDDGVIRIRGWRAVLFVIAATWCLWSGMYTLALVIREILER